MTDDYFESVVEVYDELAEDGPKPQAVGPDGSAVAVGPVVHPRANEVSERPFSCTFLRRAVPAALPDSVR